MKSVVIDASTALAWCFPDKSSPKAEAVLVALEGRTILVPSIWSLELANAVWVGERTKRIRHPEIQRFIALLDGLQVVHDVQPVRETILSVLPLARAYGLSAYDASYVELATRNDAPLATLDAKLQKAAHSAGVALFTGDMAH